MTRLPPLLAVVLALPAYAVELQPEPPTPEPEPPAVEQPEPEPRAEEDNWTCRDGLHRHENRKHLCVKTRKGKKRPSTGLVPDRTYVDGKL